VLSGFQQLTEGRIDKGAELGAIAEAVKVHALDGAGVALYMVAREIGDTIPADGVRSVRAAPASQLAQGEPTEIELSNAGNRGEDGQGGRATGVQGRSFDRSKARVESD
jgi:hypothetical protein